MFLSHLQGHTPVSSILPPGPPQSTKSSIQGPLWSLQIQAASPATRVTTLYLFPLLSCSFPLSPLPLSSFLSSPFLTLSSLLPPSSLFTYPLPFPSPALSHLLIYSPLSSLLLFCSLLPLPWLLYPSSSLNPLFLSFSFLSHHLLNSSPHISSPSLLTLSLLGVATRSANTQGRTGMKGLTVGGGNICSYYLECLSFFLSYNYGAYSS